MLDDEIIPHEGFGVGNQLMIRLGMTRADVDGLYSGVKEDMYLDYRGDPPVVACICSPKWWGTYRGIDVFEEAGDEVVAKIVAMHNYDPELYPPQKCSYNFPELNMCFWRSCPAEIEGEQGYIFDAVSIYISSYYEDVPGFPPTT